jgi:SAM-dependent methyltransferase
VAESKKAAESLHERLARYYDLDLKEDPGDVEMYLALASATQGAVLELMGGTGRVAVPLALAGHDVVAVDNDANMLARAAGQWRRLKRRAAKGGALELIEADVTNLRLKRRFGLAIVALNSILLLNGRDRQRDLLAAIAGHLVPGARAVIDVWLPGPEDLVLYDGRLMLDWVRSDRESGERVAKQSSARYDSATRTAHITTFFDAWRDVSGEDDATSGATRTSREDSATFLSVDELVSFAADAGLEVETIAGDYEMALFAAHSDRVVMVCRAGIG